MHKTSSSLQFSKRRLAMTLEPETHWVPNTDVYIAETGIVIKVELAGMQRENLELVIEGSRLKITGQRADGCRGGHCKFLVMEINYGMFESLIELPPGYDLNQAKAAYQNGFLRIDVPAIGSVPGSEG
jgi:HSP20 family protein